MLDVIRSRCDRFGALHAQGCFGDAQSGMGAAVLRSSSDSRTGNDERRFAWSLGRRDNHVAVNEAVEHCRTIAAAVDVPVNADFEGDLPSMPTASAPWRWPRARASPAYRLRTRHTTSRIHSSISISPSIGFCAARHAIDESRAHRPHRTIRRLHCRPAGSHRDASSVDRTRRPVRIACSHQAFATRAG